MSCQPIGLFDSGVGGLSVFAELQKRLPGENIIYFADTLHMPYGPKSPEQLWEIVAAILRFLQQQKVKLVIMACNTSSAVALPLAQQEFSMPLLGMIKPVVQQVMTAAPQRLGVMATAATVQSGSYQRHLRLAGFAGEIYCQACPELASLVEQGETGPRLAQELQLCATPLLQAGVEQVILGCTHYPFARGAIRSALGTTVELLNPAEAVVAAAQQYLQQEKLFCTTCGSGSQLAYVSGELAAFEQRAEQLLGHALAAKSAKYRPEQTTYSLT